MAKKAQRQPQSPAPTANKSEPAVESSREGQSTLRAPDGAEIPQSPSVTAPLFDRNAHKAAQLITLAAFCSPVSQLALSPVYGSTQAALYHRWGSLAVAAAAFAGFIFGRKYIPDRLPKFVPAWAFWIPTIQYFMFKFSSSFPVPYGPLITELVTFYPLLFLTVCTAGMYFEKVDLSPYNKTLAEQVPTLGAYLLFTAAQRAFKQFLARLMGVNILLSRIGLQLIIAGIYGLMLPTALLWPSLPAVAFTVLYNVHSPLERTTEVLHNTLALYNYTLLDRRESVTGYVSVLENTEAHFRVMRCDHSLLGGEWTMPPPKGHAPRVKDPIYAIFAMLEAVRLVETASQLPDSQRRALVIGLGIGTVPTALITHGINTTIMELDPAVHEFATKHFALPRNHTSAIGDAVKIVGDTLSAGGHDMEDYIVHDVFTGGAEPAALFTFEFLNGLKTLMKPSGIIAINYAGDLSLPATSLVVRTIIAVWPTCRMFRETAPPPPIHPRSTERPTDFTNLAIFCTKATAAPLTFRKPVEADFLGSPARRLHLLPEHEVAIGKETLGDLGDAILHQGRNNELRLLEEWQRSSAIGHWRLMRTVLPPAVWENW